MYPFVGPRLAESCPEPCEPLLPKAGCEQNSLPRGCWRPTECPCPEVSTQQPSPATPAFSPRNLLCAQIRNTHCSVHRFPSCTAEMPRLCPWMRVGILVSQTHCEPPLHNLSQTRGSCHAPGSPEGGEGGLHLSCVYQPQSQDPAMALPKHRPGCPIGVGWGWAITLSHSQFLEA